MGKLNGFIAVMNGKMKRAAAAFTGAFRTLQDRAGMFDRVCKLQDAVKTPGEQANNLTVENQKEGAAILDFIFGK